MNALIIACSVTFLAHLSNGEEPSCSKFDYDKRMLEMLVRMEADMKQRDEKQNTMEQELISLQEQLAASISEVQELKKALQYQSASLEVLNTELSDQKVNLDAQLTQLLDADAKTTFFFFMNYPPSTQLNGKLLFTKRTFSDDTWYDASTGVLTIQEDGLYYLSYTFITTSDTVSPQCDLYRNSARIIYTRGKGHYQSTSASRFILLKKGDTLEIRCFSYDYIDKDIGTFFTGAMVRQGQLLRAD